MSDFDNNWGTPNNDGWGGNDFHNDNNDNDQSFGGGDDNSYSPEEEALLRELEAEESSLDEDNSDDNYTAETSNTDDTTNDDEEDSVDTGFDIDKVKEKTISIPNSLNKDNIFNERDIYKVFNIITMLDACPDNMIGYIDNIFGLPTRDNLRRSLAIAKMESKDFDSKSSVITTIKEVSDSSDVKEGEDPIMKVIETISKVDALEDEEKNEMLSVLRKILKAHKISKRKITSTRNSGSADIIKDIHSVTKKIPAVERDINSLGEVIDAMRDIVL